MKKYILIVFYVAIASSKAFGQIITVQAVNTFPATATNSAAVSGLVNSFVNVDYRVEYGTTSGALSMNTAFVANQSPNGSGEVIVTDEPISGLTIGTKYYFKIYARETANNSNDNSSPERTFYTLSAQPNTSVANFGLASRTGSTIQLSWDAQTTNTSGYKLLITQGSSAPVATTEINGNSFAPTVPANSAGVTAINITDPNTDTYSFTNLDELTEYSFTIVPYNNNGTDYQTTHYKFSDASTVSISTIADEPTQDPASPGFAARTDAAITLTYGQVASADGYLILWKENSAVAPATTDVQDATKPTSFTDADGYEYIQGSASTSPVISLPTVGTEYSFRIIAFAHDADDPSTYNYRIPGTELLSGFTLSAQPSQAADILIGANKFSDSIYFTIDPYTFPDNGGFILYYTTGDTPQDLTDLENGDRPEAQIAGANLVFEPNDAAAEIGKGGLSAGTKYSFILPIYNTNGNDDETFHFRKSDAPTATHWTLAEAPAGGDISGADFSLSNETNATVDLDWTSTIAGADGYLVLYTKSNSALDDSFINDGIDPDNQNYPSGVGEIFYQDVNNSSATSVQVGGLDSDTDYAFKVIPYSYATEATLPVAETYQYNNDNAPLETTTTLCADPTATVSDLTMIPEVGRADRIDVSWANSSGLNALVVARLGSATRVGPTDGQEYTVDRNFTQGDELGSSGNYAVYKGTATTLSLRQLNEFTEYAIDVYLYNDNGFCYENTGVSQTQTTNCEPATTTATATSISAVSYNEATVNWTIDGAGNNVLVVARESTSSSVAPSLNQDYAEDAIFGDGETTAAGNFTVYDGSGDFVTVTGLSELTNYSFDIYEYNPTNGGFCYNTTGVTETATTTCEPPSTTASFTAATDLTAGSVTLNWTAATGADSYLIVAKQAASVDLTVNSGDDYTNDDDTNFATALVISNDNKIVYAAAGSSATITGLTANTEYTFEIYAYVNTTFCYALGPDAQTITTLSSSTNNTLSPPSAATTISSVDNDQNSSYITVMDFNMTDGGVDGIATKLSSFAISPGSGNDFADWTGVIQDAKMVNVTNSKEVVANSITANEINFTVGSNNSNGAGDFGYIEDNTADRMQLQIRLKSSIALPQIDGLNFVFQFDPSSISTQGNSSQFTTGLGTEITTAATDNEVEVIATAFEFTNSPTSPVNAGENVTPQAEVEAKDANGNLDFGYSTNFIVSNAAGIPMGNEPTGLNASFNNGVFQFPSNFNYQGSGVGTLSIRDSANTFSAQSTLVTVNPTVELSELAAGLNSGVLQSGTTEQGVLGFSIEALGSAQFQGIEFAANIDLTNVAANLKLVGSANSTYEGTGTDAVIASSPVIDNVTHTITFSGLTTENLSSEIKNYFLVLDVDESVNEFDNSTDLVIGLNMADIVFSNSANKVASTFSKSYSFEDIIKPVVDQVTASPLILSGANVSSDAIAIDIAFSEEMNPLAVPTFSFPVENPGASLIGPTGTSGWSAGNTVYTLYYDLTDEDVLIENIDLQIASAADKSGNILDNYTESNLFTIDTENPQVSSIILGNTLADPINRPDNVLELEVTFNKVMDNAIDPDFSFNGTSEMSNQGDGAWSAGDLVYTVTFVHSLVEEEINNATISISNASDESGNTMAPALSGDFNINTVRSRIERVTSSVADGIYKVGDVIEIAVEFDQNIAVSGSPTPTLDLNSGGVAVYQSTLNNVITFEYTILAGENIALLNVTDFKVNGANITNTVGNEAVLTLPGSPDRLQDNNDLEIDTESPLISTATVDVSMLSQTVSDLNLTIAYNEDMDQSSTPAFAFSQGSNINFSSGAWSDARTYVAAFEHDLATEEELQNVIIEISSATDVVGNSQVAGDSESFDVDTQSPRISEIVSSSLDQTYGPGDQINIKVVFDEDVQQIGTAPALTLNTGGNAVFDNITNGNELNFIYTIGATGLGGNTSDLDVTAFVGLESDLLDQVDNPSVLSLPTAPNRLADNADLIVDTSSPSVAFSLDVTVISRLVNQVIVTANYNEDMDQASTPSFDVQGSNNLILDSHNWTTASQYTASFTHNLTEEELQNVIIEVSEGTDEVGNISVTNSTPAITIDTQRPRILEITSTSPDGLYSPGDVLNIQLIFDEEVTVGGAPSLDLNSGGEAIFDQITNGNEVNFTYTVAGVNSGENTTDLDVTGFNMNGGTIQDLLSNNADIVLPGDPDRLQDNSEIQVDSNPAGVANITANPDQGFFTTGDQIELTIEFDEAVIVSGNPLLSLNTGSDAEFLSGSNSTALTFRYTVEASDGVSIFDVSDLEYVNVNSLNLNGGAIEDLAGIAANITLPATGSGNALSGNTDIAIDTQDPLLASGAFTPSNGEFNVSQALTFTIEMNEPVSGQGTANISIIDKNTSNILVVLDAGTAFTNNTANVLSFNSFENLLQDSTEYYIRFDQGALVDRAGNEFAGFTQNSVWSFTTFGPARIDNFSTGACVGELFTIEGQYFTGVSRIRTNVGGTTSFTISSFTIVDDENITFTVPAGTVPGNITLDKQSGQAGNTEDASTSSDQPISVGPSSAQMVLVDPSNSEICDLDDLGNENEVELMVDVVGGSGTYTLIYQVNTDDPVTISGYEEGQTFSIVPPDSAENNVRVISLTDEDDILSSCSAPDLGSDLEIIKFIRSRVDAGGFNPENSEIGVVELCGANTSIVDFSNQSLVSTRPRITGDVQVGIWTIEEGPSSNGGGFSPDFFLKSVQTDRPDTVKYYASFADGVKGEVILELTSDDPGGLNPCVGTSDLVVIRFVETIAVNTDRNVALCIEEDENGNQIAIAGLSSVVSGGSAADSLGIQWTRVDAFNEEADYDGSWGFKDDENQEGYSLTSNALNPFYKGSPMELQEGRSTLQALPLLVSGLGCGAIPDPKEVILRINDIPNPTKSIGPEIVCSGEVDVRFRMNPSNPNSTFQWSLTNFGTDSIKADGTNLNDKNQFDGAINSNLVFINFRSVVSETTDTLVVREFNPTSGCISKPDTFFISLKPLPLANIKYNSTTTISNRANLIPLQGEGGTAGNLVDATSDNGQFAGPGVVQNSSGDYFLDSSQLGVTDITDEEDVHEVVFTYTNVFGCSATDTVAFNVFDAERIFSGLAEKYCQLDEADTINVDNAIIPDGFIVSAINGPGIREIGYTDIIVGSDTIPILRAIFDPATAFDENQTNGDLNSLSITYSIEDPSNSANNAEDVGEQIVIVNPLPVLQIDDIEESMCTYDENLEFEPIGITGINYSFRLLNEGLPDGLILGDSLEGFEFNFKPLVGYLNDAKEDSIRIFVEYSYADMNSCSNSKIYDFLVWRQPSKPIVNRTQLCFVDGQMDIAVVEVPANSLASLANKQLSWYSSPDFTADPEEIGPTYQPAANFFTTENERRFYVVRRNIDSQGEQEVPCESAFTEVIFRKVDNPDFAWNKSTFGTEPVVFTGQPNQNDLESVYWTFTNISGEAEVELPVDALTSINDSTVSVNFNDFGGGRYRVNFTVTTQNSCAAEVTKEVIILPEVVSADGYDFNFNNSKDGWVSSGFKRSDGDTVNRHWDFAIPQGASAFATNETVWITNAEGSYESSVTSYVYSPSMDITNIERPVVSFDLWVNMAEQDDGLILEYSTDGKIIEDPDKRWKLLGDFSDGASSGLEWYNMDGIESRPGTNFINESGESISNNIPGIGWSQENDAESIGSVNAKHALEEIHVEDRDSLIFRFQFKSSSSENDFGNPDGAAFDNFSIESLNRNVLVEYFGDYQNPADESEMEVINAEFKERGNFAWINYRVNEEDSLYKKQSSAMLSRVYYYDAYDLGDQFAIDGEVREYRFASTQDGRSAGVNDLSRARLFNSITTIELDVALSSPNELGIEVAFQSVEDLGPDVNLYVAVVQKEISGEITYYNVLRKLLPGNSGLSVNGKNGAHSFSFSAEQAADETPLAVVAFLQNTETGEVLQSAFQDGFPLLSLETVTSVEEELAALDIKLFPNPARENLTINWDRYLQEEVNARVIDLTAKTIKEFRLEKGAVKYDLNTSSLKTGMYNLILTNQKGEYKMMKFAVTN